MSRGQILCVEDNFDNRMLVKRILEAEGYTVIEAENGVVGLERAQANHPDLILMDINLPDLDGYECTARFRRLTHLRHVPIVALTANVMEGDKQKALDAGCDGYIPKPIDVDHLPTQVAEHIHKDGRGTVVAPAPVASVPVSPSPSPSPPPRTTSQPPPPPPPRSFPPPPPPPAKPAENAAARPAVQPGTSPASPPQPPVAAPGSGGREPTKHETM
jgi:two-component system cell cycle response regulator DivK